MFAPWTAAGPAALFHGFIAVAPLKANFDCRVKAPQKPLPRLHRRGPIEVPIRASDRAEPASLFHGFIAVAPLKYIKILQGDDVDRLFHGFIAVAPLKYVDWLTRG